MNEQFDFRQPFDLQRHKAEVGKNYLEVLITAYGTVLYATPSHQEKAMALAMDALGKSRKEIQALCPVEDYGDYTNWLLSLSGSIAVWTTATMGRSYTKEQVATLRTLKLNGLYRGYIPAPTT